MAFAVNSPPVTRGYFCGIVSKGRCTRWDAVVAKQSYRVAHCEASANALRCSKTGLPFFGPWIFALLTGWLKYLRAGGLVYELSRARWCRSYAML